ncbi:L,D-transpeptidase [Ramlibacter sp. MMS24-I3-19]|uniref:L,D-transpeptidase n=1 Tax=Ramlibacter sp. MMS24-I3-19 TaxID=3416606 RepID=UPI003D06C501
MQWKHKAAALAAAWLVACGSALAAPSRATGPQQPTADAREMAQWVQRTHDAGGRPYVIVDKKAAMLFVHAASGKLLATTPVLLGAAQGDDSAPGVGDRAQSGTLRFEERTTPAGRFVTQPGTNIEGERVVWIDYDAALALHRLRPGRAHNIRAARLAHSQPQERRVSLGCVVVPVKFYLGVVEPLLGSRPGVVYVLPETHPLHERMQDL